MVGYLLISLIPLKIYVNLIFGGGQAQRGQIAKNEGNAVDGVFPAGSSHMAGYHRCFLEDVNMVKEALKVVKIHKKY